MSQPRSIDLSIEVPGTPEEVWDTIATGPGIGSWFVPHEVEGREGGAVLVDFGSEFGTHPATVTAWEPPHRFVYESGGERPLAYEWSVEARDGGTCVVRLVNSGFGAGEEWDADYEGLSNGWPIFLQNLRLQLTHFRGRRPRSIITTVGVPGPHDLAWTRLCAALGIPTDLHVGDKMRSARDEVPPIAGVVEGTIRTAAVTEYLLLLDAPSEGTAFVTTEGAGDQIACSAYLYLYGQEVDTIEDSWNPWLKAQLS